MVESLDQDSANGPPARVLRIRRSMWHDRRVRTMAIVAVTVLVLYLLTIISALHLGVIGGNQAPRTAVERDLMAWESVVRSEEATASIDQWQRYILILIDASQFQQARQVIAEVDANPALDQSMGANMLYCTAVLQHAQGQIDDALETYTEVMKVTQEAYELELASDREPNWAVAFGLHSNYYLSAIARAAIYRQQERWADGIGMLDIYLERFPQAAGILADRGFLKAQAGDLEGAEADYREALRFDPEFVVAREGLEEIGAGD